MSRMLLNRDGIGAVVCSGRRVALRWRAIAAGTGSDDFDRLAGAQSAGTADKRLDSVTQVEGAAPAGVPAREPPGRRQQARAVEPQMAFRFGAVNLP